MRARGLPVSRTSRGWRRPGRRWSRPIARICGCQRFLTSRSMRSRKSRRGRLNLPARSTAARMSGRHVSCMRAGHGSQYGTYDCFRRWGGGHRVVKTLALEVEVICVQPLGAPAMTHSWRRRASSRRSCSASACSRRHTKPSASAAACSRSRPARPWRRSASPSPGSSRSMSAAILARRARRMWIMLPQLSQSLPVSRRIPSSQRTSEQAGRCARPRRVIQPYSRTGCCPGPRHRSPPAGR